jgi:MFS-type transporter involved in bile tolerance (Atg22 family)
MIPRQVVGEAMALINSFGSLGGFAGIYLVGWLRGFTGTQTSGFILLSLAMATAGILILILPAHEESVIHSPDDSLRLSATAARA